MELVKDIFAYIWQGQGNNCNSYAIRYNVDSQTKYALIDPGHEVVSTPMTDPRNPRAVRLYEEPGMDVLVGHLRKDGIELDDIGLIINTHGHIDHCDASFALAATTGARVALHEQDKDMCNMSIMDVLGIDIGQKKEKKERVPDLYLQEGELRLGKPDPVVLQIIHTPGHSPGSISIYWPEKKALFAGDVVFYRSTGRWDLPGGDLALLKKSIANLAKLDCELLLSGHPYGHPGIIKGKKEIQTNFSFILHQMLI